MAEFIFHLLQDAQQSEAAVKCALLSQHVVLHDPAVEELHQIVQVCATVRVNKTCKGFLGGRDGDFSGCGSLH